MKSFIALFALVAVASANPLPLVQIVVNVDAPASSVGASPVAVDSIESPAIAEMPIIDFVPEEPTYNPLPLPVPQPTPIVVPEPVVLPEPVLPEVVPSPIVLPEPALPEPAVPSPEPIVIPQPEIIPEPIVLPEPGASVPITPIVNVPTPIDV